MPRIARVVGIDVPHHVTQRGNNRGQVFFDDDDRRFYIWTLAQYRRKHGVEVWGYCLMDNHMHALAVPHERDSLAKCFAGANLVYTQHVNHKYDRTGRLWQNRFFSCPVDTDEHLWSVLRYIDRNPVRAGVARRAWEYPWSSARSHALEGEDPLLNEPDWLTQEMRRRRYRSLLHSEPEDVADEIRRMTASGRPLGNAAFRAALEGRLGRVLGPRKGGRPRG
jgi:putative transposase